MKDSKLSAITNVCMTVLLKKTEIKTGLSISCISLRIRINLITMAVNAFLNQYPL